MPHIGKLVRTNYEKGKRRCDFMISDVATYNIINLCEMTSIVLGQSKPQSLKVN